MPELEVRKLEGEELLQLLMQAEKEPAEAKFLLRLSEWKRPGPSFSDEGSFEVVVGEVEKVPLDHNYNYPTTDSYEYLIIPKTIPVIIIEKSGNDFEGEYVSHENVHVFTKDGWKCIPVY